MRKASHQMGLVSQLLGEQRSVRLSAFGNSMLPSIFPGDVLTVSPVTRGEVQLGDVVLFSQWGRLVAHRVTSLEPITTRGDAFASVDAAMDEDGLLGRVTHIEKQGLVRLRRAASRILRVFRGGTGI